MLNYVLILIVYCIGCEVGSYGDVCRLCCGCLMCDVSSGLCSRFFKIYRMILFKSDGYEFN